VNGFEPPYTWRQSRHAVAFPVLVTHASSAAFSDAHCVVVGDEAGAGAAGPVGNDGVEGVLGPEHPEKHPSRRHDSYASMTDPQFEPQLVAHASIWLQMSVVASSHVVWLVSESDKAPKQSAHVCASNPLSLRHPTQLASSVGHRYVGADVGKLCASDPCWARNAAKTTTTRNSCRVEEDEEVPVPTMLVNFMMAEWMDWMAALGGEDDDERISGLLYLLGRRDETSEKKDECVRIQSDAPRSSTAVVSLPDVPDAAGASSRFERNKALPAVSSLEK
jgi:hypothetical protein